MGESAGERFGDQWEDDDDDMGDGQAQCQTQ
jgi:DnaJ family protein A protein 2